MKKKFHYFIYDSVITNAQRVISSCFDYVAPLYNASSHQQAQRELMTCNPDQKTYVKQIGDILTGQTIGTQNKLLFDQVIDDQGFCNGTEVMNLRDVMSILFAKGCSVTIITEYIEHGNASSFIDRNYCTRTLQEINDYQETLFHRCVNESVDTHQKVFKDILSITEIFEQIFLILNSTFPWFKFSLIKSECSEKCELTDTAMLISELTRFDSFYIFFHRTPRVFRMLADRQRVPIALTQFCPC